MANLMLASLMESGLGDIAMGAVAFVLLLYLFSLDD